MDAGAYDIKKQDLLVDDPRSGNPDDQAQIGEQSSRGVEASLALTVNDQWRIDANAALLHAEYEEYGEFTGNTPFSVPEQLANLWVSYQFAADWRARAGLRYVGKCYLDESNTTELPSYSVVGAALDWAVSDALTLGAHVRNAADKTYAQAAYGPQFIFGMLRTWELQARYQFCNAHPREHQQRQERWLVATEGCFSDIASLRRPSTRR